jgi:hypothetical protein
MDKQKLLVHLLNTNVFELLSQVLLLLTALSLSSSRTPNVITTVQQLTAPQIKGYACDLFVNDYYHSVTYKTVDYLGTYTCSVRSTVVANYTFSLQDVLLSLQNMSNSYDIHEDWSSPTPITATGEGNYVNSTAEICSGARSNNLRTASIKTGYNSNPLFNVKSCVSANTKAGVWSICAITEYTNYYVVSMVSDRYCAMLSLCEWGAEAGTSLTVKDITRNVGTSEILLGAYNLKSQVYSCNVDIVTNQNYLDSFQYSMDGVIISLAYVTISFYLLSLVQRFLLYVRNEKFVWGHAVVGDDYEAVELEKKIVVDKSS